MVEGSVAGSPRSRLGASIDRGLLLLDAGIGTRLVGLGLVLAVDDPCLWNLTRPDAVFAMHARDVGAGAGALVTNTFGANRRWLARFGRADQVDQINRAAVALARRAAGPDRLVLGDIGPTAVPGGSEAGVGAVAVADAVVEQAASLIDAGADALVFETYRVESALAALDQLGRDAANGRAVPILVSLVDWPDPAGPAASALIERGAVAVGLNCQEGMAEALPLAERVRRAVPPGFPIIVKPSAGRPGAGANRPLDQAGDFAAAVPRLKALGPVLAGGCCGTDADHLAAIRRAWYDRP